MDENDTFVTDTVLYETNTRVEVLLKVFPGNIKNINNFVFDVRWEAWVKSGEHLQHVSHTLEACYCLHHLRATWVERGLRQLECRQGRVRLLSYPFIFFE